MSAGVINYHLQQMLQNGFASQSDPGASGTLGIENKGLAIFEITTAGAESRALEAATRHPVGARCVVVGKDLVGALTVTGAEESVVLGASGDVAEFIVSNNDGTKVWRLLSYSPASAVLAALSAAPVALGAVDINTGDATTDTGLIALADALADLGLITHTWT